MLHYPRKTWWPFLKILFTRKPIHEIINDVENIKINFYKKHKADIERKRKNFVEAGGELEDFMPEEDPLEKELKELLKTFKDQKAEYTKVQEEQKQKNLEEKYKIIEEIKELSNKQESINKTFQEFRDLQRKWRSIGPVPQINVKNLWDNYHHHVEAFLRLYQDQPGTPGSRSEEKPGSQAGSL